MKVMPLLIMSTMVLWSAKELSSGSSGRLASSWKGLWVTRGKLNMKICYLFVVSLVLGLVGTDWVMVKNVAHYG